MSDDATIVTGKEFQAAQGVADWRVLAFGANAWFEAGSHREAAALVRKVAELSEASGAVLPDLGLRATGVLVRIAPPQGRLSSADLEQARAISTAAADLGLSADPSALQDVQLTFDALDEAAVMPFWAAALGYEQTDEDVIDDTRRHPGIWFQHQDAPRPLRNRLHLDIARPQALTRAAIDGAGALGGTVLAEHQYNALVADAEGNEADVLPVQEGQDRWGDDPTLEDWRVVFTGVACYPTGSATQAADLVEAVAALADEAGVPLGIDVRPGLVYLDTGKDTWEEVEGYDALAAKAQEAARGLGLVADTGKGRFVQLGIDAVDIPGLRRFWRAALGYQADPREYVTDIVDPRQLNMVVFFQNMDADDADRRAQRNRIHIDVFVPDDQVRARVDAALAAGGTVVRYAEAPETWTIADPEGNEIDLTYSVGREELWRAWAEQSG